jgi:hypothetical protein
MKTTLHFLSLELVPSTVTISANIVFHTERKKTKRVEREVVFYR